MQPIRARRRTIHVLLGLTVLAALLVVSPSCGLWSEAPDLPTASLEGRGRSRPTEREPGAVGIDVQVIVESSNEFALDLYARLRRESSDNLFLSTGSLSAALAMTYAGARGETADEMARVLHFRLPPEKLHPAFGDLRQYGNAETHGRGYRLSVANRLWGRKGMTFLPGFLTVIRDDYGGDLERVDFLNRTESARRRINAWVEEQTQRKIRALIPQGLLDGMTRLLLTNAVYFKGDWTKPFRRDVTQVAPFHISTRQQTDVHLMGLIDHFRYRAGDGVKVLELTYGNADLAMVALLPDEIEGLPDLEGKLTTDNLSRWLSDLQAREVRVFLPRFRLNSQLQLADALKSMGMRRVFTPGEADLSGMSSEQGLFLSAVVHKAFVDANEEGTEAAAATGDVAAKAPEGIEEPAVFRADHPFVFLIRDNRTGSVLFLGRLVNPQG
jgi:serpin B